MGEEKKRKEVSKGGGERRRGEKRGRTSLATARSRISLKVFMLSLPLIGSFSAYPMWLSVARRIWVCEQVGGELVGVVGSSGSFWEGCKKGREDVL